MASHAMMAMLARWMMSVPVVLVSPRASSHALPWINATMLVFAILLAAFALTPTRLTIAPAMITTSALALTSARMVRVVVPTFHAKPPILASSPSALLLVVA